MSIRILLADDHQITRQGLRSLLEEQEDMQVIAEADEGRTAVKLARELSPDVVIMDPPRAGVHKNVINALNAVLPQKIVYVSCNPATQARDISLLGNNYQVKRIQPVDMFPHTHHVENVILLEKK